MAGNRLTSRLDALERSSVASFTGYASINVEAGQSVADATTAWVADNGPIGSRQVVLWNFGGYSPDEWKALVREGRECA